MGSHWLVALAALSASPGAAQEGPDLVAEIGRLRGQVAFLEMQLRQRDDFPDPVAELAAGPVWRVFNLLTFIQEWPRKPGRPKKLESA